MAFRRSSLFHRTFHSNRVMAERVRAGGDNELGQNKWRIKGISWGFMADIGFRTAQDNFADFQLLDEEWERIGLDID